MNIIDFIRARLDEEQALAEGAFDAQSNRWIAEGGGKYDEEVTIRSGTEFVVTAGLSGGGGVCDRGTADHIAAQDPARTLAHVAALRVVLAAHPPDDPEAKHPECKTCVEDPPGVACWGDELYGPDYQAWPCPTLRALASTWTDHPDHNPEWSLT